MGRGALGLSLGAGRGAWGRFGAFAMKVVRFRIRWCGTSRNPAMAAPIWRVWPQDASKRMDPEVAAPWFSNEPDDVAEGAGG